MEALLQLVVVVAVDALRTLTLAQDAGTDREMRNACCCCCRVRAPFGAHMRVRVFADARVPCIYPHHPKDVQPNKFPGIG